MKPVPVDSEEEFGLLLDHLANDALRAGDLWTLRLSLDQAMGDYGMEFHQSPAFWHLTLSALIDGVMFYLARLYDEQNGALGLRSFLLTVQSCQAFFDAERFKERLKDNPYVYSLAATDRAINQVELEAEVQSVSSDDPTVRKLLQIRNRYIVHRDSHLIRLSKVSVLGNMTVDEITNLLQRGRTIVNKYSNLYRASTYSSSILGSDDYTYLLNLVRLGVNAKRASEDRL